MNFFIINQQKQIIICSDTVSLLSLITDQRETFKI